MKMNAKHWRMENAKLARAYLRGGEAPFQVANKLGFHSVMDMEAAIWQLETLEEHPPVERGPLKAEGEWQAEPFLVKKFAADKEHAEMIRIWCGGRPNYVYFDPKDAKRLIRLLNDATGALDELYKEFAELTEERNQEARGQAEELQKNEELRAKLANLEKAYTMQQMQLKDRGDLDEAMVQENTHLLMAIKERDELINKLKGKIADLVMGV